MNAKLREAKVITAYTSQHDGRRISENLASKHFQSFIGIS